MTVVALKKPVITEKSLGLANGHNTYTFEVDRNATKDQIKQVVQDTFKVTVLKVNTVTQNESTKKTGKRRMSMIVAPVKKALVTLKKGETIELFDIYNDKK